jgi:hypothetical protein
MDIDHRATTTPAPTTAANNVHSCVVGVITVLITLLKRSLSVYGGKTATVKFDEGGRGKVSFFELVKISPPLFVISFGNEILADIGTEYDGSGFALSRAFIYKLETPAPEGSIGTLFGDRRRLGAKTLFLSMPVVYSSDRNVAK